jgi:hypothetical protein
MSCEHQSSGVAKRRIYGRVGYQLLMCLHHQLRTFCVFNYLSQKLTHANNQPIRTYRKECTCSRQEFRTRQRTYLWRYSHSKTRNNSIFFGGSGFAPLCVQCTRFSYQNAKGELRRKTRSFLVKLCIISLFSFFTHHHQPQPCSSRNCAMVRSIR